MTTSLRASRRSVTGSSVRCGWAIWRRTWRLPWRPGACV